MKLLIWCPLYSGGGGSRLFIHLLIGILNNKMVTKVDLIIPEKYFDDINIYTIDNNKLFIHTIKSNGNKQSWLEKKGRVLLIPGTGLLKRIIRRFRNRLFSSHYSLNNSEFERLLSILDYDLLYCFWPHFQEYHFVDKPVVCTIQDTILFEFPELIGAYYTNLERGKQLKWLHNSTRIIVSSENTKNNLSKYLGYFQNIDIVRHDAVPDFNQNLYNIDDLNVPERYIIYPANISPHKNHYNLIIAWSKLKDRKKFPLLLIGARTDSISCDKEEYPIDFDWHQLRLAGLIKRLGLKKNEDFFSLGFIDDKYVMGLIKNAYALIMPSLAEGGGSYPVEEALSVGTPVLCSDIPVMREHVNKRTAEICWFNPESPDSIVAAVNKLIENYKEFKETTIKGIDDIRPTWNYIASGYIDVFEKAIMEYNYLSKPPAQPV